MANFMAENNLDESEERQVIETISPSIKSCFKVVVKRREKHETKSRLKHFIEPLITPVRTWHRLQDSRRQRQPTPKHDKL